MSASLDPDESGFDADLRALASRIMDAPGAAPGIFGRPWREDGIFRAMQCCAVLSQGPKADVLARCEALGRAQARLDHPGAAP